MPAGVEPAFAWGRSRCVRRYNAEWFEDEFLKDLKKVRRLGYSLERVLIVEDTPRKVHRHYGNAIYVPPYLGAADDDVLPRLARYLDSIHQTPNVRVLEKRGWMQPGNRSVVTLRGSGPSRGTAIKPASCRSLEPLPQLNADRRY